MLKSSTQKSSTRLLAWGGIMAPLAWLADCILDAVLFEQGTILKQILSPTSHEVASRVLFITFILATTFLGRHLLTNASQRERSLLQNNRDLGLAIHDIEEFNHELLQQTRNTTAEIITAIEILRTQTAGDPEEKDRYFLESIESSSKKLIKQLETSIVLNEVPMGQPHRKQVKIDKLALEIAEELKRKNPERELEFEIQPWMKDTLDRNMLWTVLYNLFSNSVDHIPPHRKGHIKLGMLQRANEKVFFIRDNGIGFTDAQAKRLFDAFREIRDKNLPADTIRLASSQRIIHRHGGRIWAEGAEGAGGTIYFTCN